MKIHGTAKGGALSKKDFGVAFGGGRTFTLVWENTATGTNFYVAASPNIPAGGQAFYTGHVAIGEVPTKITFNLKKTDTPFEDAELKLIASDGTTVKASFGTIDASTLTTSYVTHEFTNLANTEAIANGDRLAWFYNFDNADGTFDFQGSTAGIGNTAATYSVNLSTWVDRTTESTMAIYSG